MRILAIETTAKASSCAVVENDLLVAEYYSNVNLHHSKTLMPMVDNLLKNCEIPLEQIDCIAVANGPGSFTGVRIGVSAAKGIAIAKNIPCFAVSTLEALAYNIMFAENCVLCPVMDARCSQVYNALFQSDGTTLQRLTPDRAISIEDLTRELKNNYNKRIILVGDGATLCYNNVKDSFEDIQMALPQMRFQKASSVGFVALQKTASGEKPFDCSLLNPEYLRPSQAERNLNKK